MSFVLTATGRIVRNLGRLAEGNETRARAVYDVLCLGPSLGLIGCTALYAGAMSRVLVSLTQAMVLFCAAVVGVAIFVLLCAWISIAGGPEEWQDPQNGEVIWQRVVPAGAGFVVLWFELIVLLLFTQ